MKRDLLTILDLSSEEIEELLKRAVRLKGQWQRSKLKATLAGKSLGLLFDKPSTRTRVSFQVAMYQLGGQVVVLTTQETQLSRDESLADTARVLSRYLNGLVVRTFADARLEELSRNSGIPVINGLTDLYHPCQVLSDLMTVTEKKGDLSGLHIAWVGDGNNVAHSWINAAARLPIRLALACPAGYEPRREILAQAQRLAKYEIRVCRDPGDAATGADVINTDVWASMGQEQERKARLKAFGGYQVDGALLRKAKPDALVLHCLPAHRGEEISDEVMDGPNSGVLDQAENRLHFQRALLDWILGGDAVAGARREGQGVRRKA
jgi:ornithine carbamoyltransferase